MMAQKNVTTPKSAKIILGRKNVIGINEVLTLFPTPIAEIASYEEIPFGNELLYRLSSSKNQFILFPGLPFFGKKKPLTMQSLMESQQFGGFFEIGEESRIPAIFHINQKVCDPRWYLISKEVMSWRTLRNYLICEQEIVNDQFKMESMIVYVFAWILFYKLRNKELFGEGSIACSDKTTTSGNNAEFSLKIYNKQISLLPWQPKRFHKPPENLPIIAPSILPNTI